MIKCKYCGRILGNAGAKATHEPYCKENPNKQKRKTGRFKKGNTPWNKGLTTPDEVKRKISESISKSQKGKPLTEERKNSISEGMKKAHREGKAWNIGKSRWNNKQSYPEEFFEKVINNEFEDKNYETEYPLGIYSLDFAWPHLKKCIEIDGDQHQRFKEYQERDKRKDEFILSEGWIVLRISWKDMYNDTKNKIQEAKEFIL